MPLRKMRPDLDVPEAVERVLHKAMQRNPDDRYQTALEFADAFAARRERNVAGDATPARRAADCSASCSVADDADAAHVALLRSRRGVALRDARSAHSRSGRIGPRSTSRTTHRDRLPDTGATIHARRDDHGRRKTQRVRHAACSICSISTCDSVTVDGRSAKFVRRPSDDRDSAAARRRHERRRIDVAVDYGGAVTDGLIARADSAGRWTYFGDNWPNRARHWIPSIDHPSDKATVTWRVTAPPSQTVVANGKLVSTRTVRDRRQPNAHETVWRESQRIPVYLMVIAAAPLERVRPRRHGVRARPRRSDACRSTVYIAPEQRRLLARPVRARRRDRAALREPRRSVSVREARAPAVVDALRRNGERQRDLLRRRRRFAATR